MRTFENPWYDVRNELSPKHFTVTEEPIESVDVLDFYGVRGPHGQRPSVLAVVNCKREGSGVDRAVGQYVTVAGAKRALLAVDHTGYHLKEKT